MKRLGRVLLISSAAVLPHLAAASPDPEPSLEPLGALSWRLDWTGAAGWTWFIQWSEDLVTWHYFPVIEHGTEFDFFEFSTNADRFFLRLEFTDIPTTDPEVADFDGDGLSNLFEVVNGLDPFSADTDGDLVADGDEDEDLDGSVNTSEAVSGRDPKVKDHPAVKLGVVVGN